jgi:hypothetical protein
MSQKEILGLLEEGKTILIPVCDKATIYMRLRGKEIESDIVFSNVEEASKEFGDSVVWLWWLDDC